MRIKNLYLKNFRNYEDENIEFSDGLNVIFGRNAQNQLCRSRILSLYGYFSAFEAR